LKIIREITLARKFDNSLRMQKKRKNVKELDAFLEQPKAEKFKLPKRKCDKTEIKITLTDKYVSIKYIQL
jgi:hypothetical protein